MSDSICRWGFLSTAGIGRKNWKGIHLSGNGRVSAVASRSVDKAQSFIDECSIEVPQGGDVAAVGSYEELLSRDDVDAVYVPLPTRAQLSPQTSRMHSTKSDGMPSFRSYWMQQTVMARGWMTSLQDKSCLCRRCCANTSHTS